MKAYVVEAHVTMIREYELLAESRGIARQMAIQLAMQRYGVKRDVIDAIVIAECDCGYSFDSDNLHHTEECPCATT